MHVLACMMRTTIDINPEQHEALSALARRRGVRGFSSIVEEALTAYLQDVSADEVDVLLGLEGSISDEEAVEIRSRIEDARTTWRAG